VRCGASNEGKEKFCGDCGAPLEKVATHSDHHQPVSPAERAVDGERRHLTVLFCDLVESTAIAAGLDPEEWRDIEAEYQVAAAEAVRRLHGHVAKYLGDGLLAFFGYPRAHEDDGEYAVRAGLAIVDAIASINARLTQERRPTRLSVRVGIHTGSVVVGQGGGSEADVFGDVPNVAARVQAAAEPNSVFITRAMNQLVSGLFVVEDRGARGLKGIKETVQLYRVIQPSAARRRVHRSAHAAARFVGREDEIALLMNRWERARQGRGQVVTVIGEPGIGKSRMVEEYREHIKNHLHLWVECGGEPFFEKTPFHPVTEMLNHGLGWRGDESPEERLGILERSLNVFGMNPSEAVPLIGEMLNLPVSEKYPPSALAPDQKRKRLLTALAEWVFGATGTQPMVIAAEDMHWVDPSTLELMQMLVEQSASHRLILLFTARPEFKAPWPMRSHHTQITLSRLEDRHTREMIASMAARVTLDDDVIDAVVKRADGVPLFAEELTHLIVEGNPRAASGEIPATLHDSLLARLDALDPAARDVAQVAAVLGRDFSYPLLLAVSQMAPADLQLALTKLSDAELIYANGIPPDASYEFKHALVRDAAYDALLKSRRKILHRRVAETLTAEFPALAEAKPEIVARHWTDAGDGALAIDAWRRAADHSMVASAYAEAEASVRQALAVLNGMDQTAERDSRELALQLALAQVLITTKGWSATSTISAFARARMLAERTGGAESLPAFVGLWQTTMPRCEFSESVVLADTVLEIAQQVNNPRYLVSAHFEQGLTRLYLGDPAKARENLAEAIRHYREEDFRGIADDQGASAHGFKSHAEWLLGYPDEALRHRDDGCRLARRLNKQFALAFGNTLKAYTDGLRGDFTAAIAAADESIAICDKMGIPVIGSLSKVFGYYARAQAGEVDGATKKIADAIAELSAAEFHLVRSHNLCRLAETQALVNALADAFDTIELALATHPDELIYRPLLFRVRGELRLRRKQTDDLELAERDFREAIALAQKMATRSLELRATSCLARLLRDWGRREEALAMLSKIYGWFTEGFDTPDLKEAKTLLEQLNA
jgi:class 3 adenylate cyclase/tetratricopeptide (TPR) repeat protein